MYVELRNVNKQYKDYQASKDISFGIEQGELVGLLGPSGSGKTTILRMIAGLETPDSGEIYIDGNKVNYISPARRGIGFVFQNYALFRHMTVYENIGFGLNLQKMEPKIKEERIRSLMELTGLLGLEKRYPHQISGGQKQRVAFARAIAPNPRLLLLDEPFAAMDAKLRKELRLWLKQMIKQIGMTSIFVTHDQEEAVEVADKIIVTNLGRVEQKGTPIDIYKKPSTSFVANFIGESTILEDCSVFKAFTDIPKGKKAVIRPEFLQIGRKHEIQFLLAADKGTITDIAFRGSSFEITIKVGEVMVTARRSLEEDPLMLNEEVYVLVHRIYLFDHGETKIIENKLKEDPMPIMI